LPSHKSCAKRMRQSTQERLNNRALRSELRSALKAVRSETTREEATKKLRVASRLLDRASSRHLLHRRNADRNKSRLAQYVNNLD